MLAGKFFSLYPFSSFQWPLYKAFFIIFIIWKIYSSIFVFGPFLWTFCVVYHLCCCHLCFIDNNCWQLIHHRYEHMMMDRKRSCLINAGLSNNCDFRDFISASNARRIWESQASPGKRSSNSLSTYHSYQVPPINRLSYYSSSYPSSYDSSSYKSWLLEQQQQQQQKPSIIDDESMIKNIE